MQIKELFTVMLEKTAAGEDTALATIVAETGSSPRSAGAHMLVDTTGRVCGAIGGGTVEYNSIQYARQLLERRQSRRKTYGHHHGGEEPGTDCGGDMDIYFQFIEGGDGRIIALMKRVLARLEKDEDLWLFIDLTDPMDWAMALYGADVPLEGITLDDDGIKALARNKGVMITIGDRRIYGEPINFAGKVFIFGAGHVAQALTPVLAGVGFRCVIYDNREEYVGRELFPAAQDLVIGDYEGIVDKLGIGSRDYIVILTHAFDITVLRQIISKNCAYIGVIGSKPKVAMIRRQLLQDGVSEETLNNINAPIGLKIRSETPEEIAVSITGEMIMRRAEVRAAALG
jgi:xanthine dehydrogenase accessory factor